MAFEILSDQVNTATEEAHRAAGLTRHFDTTAAANPPTGAVTSVTHVTPRAQSDATNARISALEAAIDRREANALKREHRRDVAQRKREQVWAPQRITLMIHSFSWSVTRSLALSAMMLICHPCYSFPHSSFVIARLDDCNQAVRHPLAHLTT